MKNNVIELENYQLIREENNALMLEEFIDNLLLEAQDVLDFEPIPKNAKGDDWDYNDGEVYHDNNGKTLMGYPVYSSYEFYEEGYDGTVEMEKEIFLTEEGKFFLTYTVTESDYCSSCEQFHCRVHRIIANDQSLSTEEAEAVLNLLLIELDEEPLFFE